MKPHDKLHDLHHANAHPSGHDKTDAYHGSQAAGPARHGPTEDHHGRMAEYDGDDDEMDDDEDD